MFDEVRASPLFPRLSDQQMQCLSEHGIEIRLNPSDLIYTEGDPTYDFYVVLEGKIKVTKQVGGEETVLAIHEAGEFTGELSLLTGSPTLATACALSQCRLLRIKADAFKAILSQCDPVRDILISAMTYRVKEVEVLMKQREKLAALGKLSAGLAHELNNPAAAGQRAAGQLRSIVQSLQSLALKLNRYQLTTAQVEFLTNFQSQAIERTITLPALDPLAQSDREDEVTDWLDAHDVVDGWKLACNLVGAGIDIDSLDSITEYIPSTALSDVITWLEAMLAEVGLLNEVEQSTARISGLVKAVKEYSYMDSAPMQEVDIHEGLESTLTILGHKLKHGVVVTREYDRNLPRITAYGSELNQVWTNLIDNAIDAMGPVLREGILPSANRGKGQIWIRTSRENTCILVEIADNGAGIPPEIQSRIFEPFFTTKGVGEGSGLGLDIAYRVVVKRHHGDIRVQSQPGNTRFQVRLPITGA